MASSSSMSSSSPMSSYMSSSMGMASSSSMSSSSSAALSSSSLLFFSAASNMSFSPSFFLKKVSSANFWASSRLSVTRMSSNTVPDLTCHISKPTWVHPSLQTAYIWSSYAYSGLGILGWTHLPLYSGLSTMGASHSPSSSSSQSSGFSASGSGSSAGMSSYPAGFSSSGSGIFFSSTQSSGLDWSGSLISLSGRKSNSSSSFPAQTDLLSMKTSKVLSGRRTRVYRWLSWSLSVLTFFLIRRLSSFLS